MEWLKTLALAVFLSSPPAWADSSAFPESVDENGGKAMTATYAGRYLHRYEKYQSRDVFPGSVDENPGKSMRTSYADRHRNDTRSARAGFPVDADALPQVLPKETRVDRRSNTGG